MVQRKAPTGSDPVKTEKQFGKFKPSLQRQDSRNRGLDMIKKKRKTTLPIRVSDIGCFNSPPAVKTTGGSPNYMKGTSSSEARRESLLFQVRSQKPLSDSGSKILLHTRKNQKGTVEPGSDSANKQKKILFRSLTKTWSFKKRCRISCSAADASVQKATCSSTLKDSKASEYLILNPGGTEAEGTSVLKVCPYTYCSLNGHLHKQHIPLRSFISARRRMMKKTTLRSSQKDACDPSKPDDVSGESEKSQLSLSFSDGAPRSEIDSEENFKCFPKDRVLLEAFPDEERVGDEEDSEAKNGETDAGSSDFTIGDETDVFEPDERSECSMENRDFSGDDATDGEETDQETETLEDFMDEKFPETSGDLEDLGDAKEQEEAKEDETIQCSKGSFTHAIKTLDQEQQDACKRIWMIGSKKTTDDEAEDSRAFNPREPNYLPIIPDPDAESINLKHQDINEKNTEELMIDYALQQAVSKLSSARRNKKVALLVAAFETVVPKPKSGDHVRQIQACN